MMNKYGGGGDVDDFELPDIPEEAFKRKKK